jgi:hypothetical protein
MAKVKITLSGRGRMLDCRVVEVDGDSDSVAINSAVRDAVRDILLLSEAVARSGILCVGDTIKIEEIDHEAVFTDHCPRT